MSSAHSSPVAPGRCNENDVNPGIWEFITTRGERTT
jgi:hypothetical protein